MKLYLPVAILMLLCSCSKKIIAHSDLIKKVAKIEDSITVGEMTIQNAFKYQILAHNNNTFDSVVIFEKVYKPNKYAFDNCLSKIFGDSNGKKFITNGIYNWNRNLLTNNEKSVRQKLGVLDSVDINFLFKKHLNALEKITGQKGKGKWLVYFGPENFQIFGGCDNNSMILDMMGNQWNTKSIHKVFAHELEHLIFGPILEKDPNGNNGIGITLDEGLAVYFTYKYLKQSVNDALYGNETKLLLEREKEIFEKLEPYLYKNNEQGCPIFRHCGRNNDCKPIITGLPKEVENELCYFLGFRIIEKYEEKNGKDSWKDIYTLPLKAFFEKSGYSEFIKSK